MLEHENPTTEEAFNSAVTIIRNLPKEGPIKPSDELKLKFYAYFKQATDGPNNTPKPRFYQIVESYKWDAWKKLGDMSRDDAMLNYIREFKQAVESLPQSTNMESSTDLESSKERISVEQSISVADGGSFLVVSQSEESEDGYTTPRGLQTPSPFARELSDQFEAAMLRLRIRLFEQQL